MLYVRFENGQAVEAVPSVAGYDSTGFETRNDWQTLARAEQVARELTEATGKPFIGTDAGRYTSPRYDVIAAPVLGAPVSRSFNGDSYPAGTITKISKSLRRVETSDGSVFFRRGQSASWVNVGTWGMTMGHVDRRNPEF